MPKAQPRCRRGQQGRSAARDQGDDLILGLGRSKRGDHRAGGRRAILIRHGMTRGVAGNPRYLRMIFVVCDQNRLWSIKMPQRFFHHRNRGLADCEEQHPPPRFGKREGRFVQLRLQGMPRIGGFDGEIKQTRRSLSHLI